jgi:hypothetical protein
MLILLSRYGSHPGCHFLDNVYQRSQKRSPGLNLRTNDVTRPECERLNSAISCVVLSTRTTQMPIYVIVTRLRIIDDPRWRNVPPTSFLRTCGSARKWFDGMNSVP